jgi:hypothetical protein
MSLSVEDGVDAGMDGEETLGRGLAPEEPDFPLSFADRQMSVLQAIVFPQPIRLANAFRTEVADSRPSGGKTVCDDRPESEQPHANTS